tara:strand:- start:1819 stop:2409 length:591 start_codon:yes stop_codon:yes gene_type:complete
MSGDLCFDSIDGKFAEVLSTTSWRAIEEDFRRANTVFIIGNGGNLAIADHASVDVSRLTNKKALCPGSGILGSSLINDTTYNDWLDDWLTLQVRDMSEEQIKGSLVIGISSSGRSHNVIKALESHHTRGAKAALITALDTDDDISVDNKVILDVEAYHTAEVLTLLLTYQLIKASGHECPLIREKRDTEMFHKKYL